jgi:glycosyltransferase involved in cell wall biosynthesis
MKIVYVSDAIYPYNKGGKEKRLFEMSTHLAAAGHDIHIYTMHWWQGKGKERTEQGVHLHAISKKYEMYHGDRRSIKEGIMFALACFKLFTVKFDVIDVDHMPFFPVITTWVVCTLTFRHKKFFGTWHEALSKQDWVDYMGRSGFIAAGIERFSTKLPYRISAASAQTTRQLATYHHRKKRVELIANGIDTKLLNRVEPANVDCDVLYVGRLVKGKNVDVLIRAMEVVAKQNPDIRCIIVGHGVEKTNLEKLVSKLKLTEHVTIMDPLPEATEVYAYMKRAKVYVLPSIREGFGIVALEALGCGTPVITVDAPANAAKDLIEDDVTGSVVALNPQAIAKAIERWISVEPKHAIAKEVSDYAWEKIATKQAEVYAL